MDEDAKRLKSEDELKAEIRSSNDDDTVLVIEYLFRAREVNEAREQYNQKKLNYKEAESKYLIGINWDEVNQFRKEKGLPKIGNDKARQAYIMMECGLLDLKRELYEMESNLKFKEDMLELAKYKFKLACRVTTIP